MGRSFNKVGVVFGGSFSAGIYSTLNGYGSVIVKLEFISTDFREPIETAILNAGWLIEDRSRWEERRQLTLVRTGSGVVGLNTRERFINELQAVLSSIPNSLIVLEPRLFRPDYRQMPRWGFDMRGTNADPLEMKSRSLGIYGAHAAVSNWSRRSFPRGKLVPGNSASRLDPSFSGTPPRVAWMWLWVILLPALFGLFALEALKPALRDVPVVNWVYFSFLEPVSGAPGSDGTYFLLLLWLLFCWLLYWGLLFGASSTGVFKDSEFKLKLLRNKGQVEEADVREAIFGWAWPTDKITADPGTKIYMRIKYGTGVLAVAGISLLAGRMLGSGGSAAFEDPEGLAGAITLLGVSVVIWFGSRLATTHWVLLGRPLPRLAFNVGSAALGFAVLVRLPAWAYLEGAGVGSLISAVDWTQLISFIPDLLALTAIAGLCWLMLWTAKRQDGLGNYMLNIVAIITFLFAVTSDVQLQMTAGYGLRVQGTSEFARINYPVPACLQHLTRPDTFEPVWLLGTRDSQTFVTPRSTNGDPLNERGRISAFPTDSFTLKLAAYENLNGERSLDACRSTQ